MKKSTKMCCKCKIEKDLINFRFRPKINGFHYNCNECQKLYEKARYAKRREQHLSQKREKYKINSKIMIERTRNWRLKNPDKVRANAKKNYTIEKRISSSIRGGIWAALKKNKNGYSWESLLGYSVKDLMIHLESLFTEGMTWNNYGRKGWHIDHIKPRCLFNYSTHEDPQFRECWALSNLRPLWEHDNLSMGGKLAYKKH